MENNSGHDEKRNYCRLAVDAEVSFDVSDNSHEYKGQCINLSHSGILFDTEHSLSEGQNLEISIDTKSEKFQPMNATIQIIRVETTANNLNRVAGKILEFK